VSEKRKHQRKPIDLPVVFVSADGVRQTSSFRDLSLGGGFIVTANPPPYETKLELEVHFAGLDGQSRIAATVRWTQHDGMGVQFGVMGARETHALLSLLEQG
jgi:type IV pilus assembly protein PilZ